MYRLSRMLLVLSAVAMIYCVAILAAVMWPGSAWVIGLVAAAYVIQRRGAPLTTLGSARWASEGDFRQAGMLGADRGLILGRLPLNAKRSSGLRRLFSRRVGAKEACGAIWSPSVRRGSELVRLPGAVHTAIFSRSGGGKGVSCVIPHCMTCTEGMVILDPKGEIAQKTAEIRRKRFGQQIALLDPYKIVTQTPDTYNPLDFIDEQDPRAIEHCRNMANAIVEYSPQERDLHWPQSAAMWIGGIIGVVVVYGKRGESRSLKTVYEFLSHPERRELAVKLMCESTCWDGALAAIGGQLMNFVEREKASVLTTIARNLSFVGTPAVMASVQSSTFDPRLLRTGKLTVYLILPPSHQRTQAGLMRLWISSLLENVVSGGLVE